MSNDKTLATAKHGGCVQLPTSERERFEAWADDRGLDTTKFSDNGMEDSYDDLNTGQSWDAWLSALSAQPSPGGQVTGVCISDSDRAVLQRLQDALPFAGINGWGKGVEVLERLLRDSLAARQPVELIAHKVGDYRVTVAEDAVTVSHGRDIVFAYSAGDAEPIMARQPVGDEERAETYRKGWEAGHTAQAVGEPVARLIEAVEGECDGLTISAETAASILAHVLPLGQEPAGYMVDGRIEQGLFFDKTSAEAMAAMNAGDVVPLFRSPAQAVDLEPFRPFVEAQRYEYISHGLTPEDDCVAECDELLALIDSQAVGNGQPELPA